MFLEQHRTFVCFYVSTGTLGSLGAFHAVMLISQNLDQKLDSREICKAKAGSKTFADKKGAL